MQRLIVRAIAALMLTVFVVTTVNASVPILISHQGLLTDGGGTPVNGPHTLTFRIFESPVGGAPLWTEVQPGVAITGGLFTVTLGSVTPLSSDVLAPAGSLTTLERYLEIQVDADPAMTPRTRLIAAPYAVASGRVAGDIETQPGTVGARFRSGTKYWKFSCDARMDSSSAQVGYDADDDGSLENSITQTSRTSGVELAIKTKGTGAQRYSINAGAGSDSSGLQSAFDENGDGIPERRFQTLSNASSARAGCVADLNGDGVADNSALQTADATGARLAIKTKGTSAQRYSVNLGTATDSSVIENGSDEDGDGRENSVFSSVSNVLKCSASCLFDLDDDGVADNTVVQTTDAVAARLAIKTKGTSAHRQSATLDAVGDSGVTFDLTSDSGGVGGRSGSQHHYINFRQTVSSLASDIDGDGTADHTVTESTNDSLSSVVVTSRFHNGPRQTTSQDGTFSHASSRCATDVDNDGNSDLSTESYSDSTTARVIVQKHLLEPHEARLQVDGTGPSLALTQQAVLRCLVSPDSGIQQYDAGGAKTVDFDANGDGYVAGNMKFGAIAGAHRIDVVGGAYCDGTNWVNASDANSKEHFQAVNGGQLLEQLMQLPITRWNYKGQTAAEHIGPTAQDFRATFGVGADNKSISTIDPSGIALAAIQQLNRKNIALQNQNQELKSELDELKRKVDALLSKQ